MCVCVGVCMCLWRALAAYVGDYMCVYASVCDNNHPLPQNTPTHTHIHTYGYTEQEKPLWLTLSLMRLA